MHGAFVGGTVQPAHELVEPDRGDDVEEEWGRSRRRQRPAVRRGRIRRHGVPQDDRGVRSGDEPVAAMRLHELPAVGRRRRRHAGTPNRKLHVDTKRFCCLTFIHTRLDLQKTNKQKSHLTATIEKRKDNQKNCTHSQLTHSHMQEKKSGERRRSQKPPPPPLQTKSRTHFLGKLSKKKQTN